jgi:hypothetical protein
MWDTIRPLFLQAGIRGASRLEFGGIGPADDPEAGADAVAVLLGVRQAVGESQVLRTCGVGLRYSGPSTLSKCRVSAFHSAGSRSPSTRVVEF